MSKLKLIHMSKIISVLLFFICLLIFKPSYEQNAMVNNHSDRGEFEFDSEQYFGDPTIPVYNFRLNDVTNTMEEIVYAVNMVLQGSANITSYYDGDDQAYIISISQLPLPDYENMLTVIAFFPDDTISGGINLYYCKPLIHFDSIESEGVKTVIEPQNIIHTPDAQITTIAGPACSSPNNHITQVLASFNDGELVSVWEGYEYNQVEVTFNITQLNPDGLQPGENKLMIWALGDQPNELSDPDSTYIFYHDFDYGELEANTICRYDSNYRLTGLPEGGYFSGEGIVGNTNIFNPSLVPESVNTVVITYEYPVYGTISSVQKEIYLLNIPVLSLEGSLQVCSNATDEPYQITLNDDISLYTIDWHITGGDTLEGKGTNSSKLIHWGQAPGPGKINVKAYPLSPGQGCFAENEFIIDIDPTTVPDKSFLLLQDKLLVCSYPSANYYIWYKNDECLDTTENQQYYFLGPDFSLNETDVFYVCTAFDISADSCCTKSFLYPGENENPDKATLFNNFFTSHEGLNIYPNPNNGQFTVSVLNEFSGKATFKIFNMYGQEVYGGSFIKENEHFSKSFNLEFLTAGLYLVEIDMGSIRHLGKVHIY